MAPGLLDWDDAQEAIRLLLERSEDSGYPVQEPLVVLGGTAMAALRIREVSWDVDVFVGDVSAQVVHEVELELRGSHGERFRLDATSGENLWGSILVRDIGDSPQVATLTTPSGQYVLRALSVEDLFLVKLAAGRSKDLDDLPLLAPHTSPAPLVARFNQLLRWHGDRGAILGYADSFVRTVTELYDVDAASLIDDIDAAAYVTRELTDAWLDPSA